MTTLLAFLFVLGVLVFVHELGHYLAARRVGVRVLVFSLGFGPKLLKTTRGDTEYCISAIPLGGYVKMAGESPDDPRSGAPDEFMSKSKWQRFQVLIAGPAMNVILAVVVLAIVLAQGAQVPAYQDEPPVVGAVEEDSPAARAGIQPGDRILTVAGREVDTWDRLFLEIGTRASQNVAVTLLRDGRTMAVNVTPVPQSRFEIGDIGVQPDVQPFFPRLNPGEPADRAGFKAGDTIVAVDGKRITSGRGLIAVIAANPNTQITMTVLRDGTELQVPVTPTLGGCTGVASNVGCIGASISEPTKTFQPGPWEAVMLSVERNIEGSGLIFRTLGGLFVGQTSIKQLQGPVAIAQLSGESAQLGWIALFSLMATLSLNLGLLNLLPIPMLDGGHILIMGLEGIARRDFSMAVKEKMLLAGFVLILMLMVTVIYNDLTRVSWLEQLMPWRN
ncbi:MAG: RIP metalloprotease RseP [Vicinamibacterales bacterium]